MESICVVHLARAKNGLSPFERFVQSYSKWQAGLPHTLLIIYKGFTSREAASHWERIAKPFRHQSLMITDLGFDLRAFRVAAEWSKHSHLFFLNSFSEILAHDWLAKPYALLHQEGVGIVGATGSWESMYSNALKAHFARPTVASRLVDFARIKTCEFCFDPFPNHHIRTNAFLMHRELMLKLWPRYIFTKRGAYLFENGKQGLTKRIISLGLRPLVVGKDGVGYEMHDWPQSRTFRQSEQENLLIADNQTRCYQQADQQSRRQLKAFAWEG